MNDIELRELDAWIAFHVTSVTTELVKIRKVDISFFPHYTTDPAAAMQVLEKCAKNRAIVVNMEPNGKCQVAEAKRGTLGLITFGMTVTCDTMPQAICWFAKQLFSQPPTKATHEEDV